MTISLSKEEWDYNKGGSHLRKRYMILSLMLVFLFAAGLSMGQDTANNTSSENTTALNATALNATTLNTTLLNATAAENATALKNVTAPESAAAPANVTEPANETEVAEAAGAAEAAESQPEGAATPNLQYIWSVTGLEDGQVTMVLNQDGKDLLGQAKYEPDSGEPWNADVVGSVSGDKVDLVLTALKGETMVTTKMSGTFADEAINGNFSQINGGKVSKTGEFSAMWINPDVSSYTPAEIKKPAPVTQPAVTENATTTPAATATTTGDQTQTTQQPVQLGRKKPVDVHEYADKMGPGGDLSGVPPGMSGL